MEFPFPYLRCALTWERSGYTHSWDWQLSLSLSLFQLEQTFEVYSFSPFKMVCCVFKYNIVAMLNSGIIASNYSSEEQRDETREIGILTLSVLRACLSVVQSHSILFVLLRKLFLSWNENSSSGPNKFGSWWTRWNAPGSQRLLCCCFSAFCVGGPH